MGVRTLVMSSMSLAQPCSVPRFVRLSQSSSRFFPLVSFSVTASMFHALGSQSSMCCPRIVPDFFPLECRTAGNHCSCRRRHGGSPQRTLVRHTKLSKCARNDTCSSVHGEIWSQETHFEKRTAVRTASIMEQTHTGWPASSDPLDLLQNSECASLGPNFGIGMGPLEIGEAHFDELPLPISPFGPAFWDRKKLNLSSVMSTAKMEFFLAT